MRRSKRQRESMVRYLLLDGGRPVALLCRGDDQVVLEAATEAWRPLLPLLR